MFCKWIVAVIFLFFFGVTTTAYAQEFSAQSASPQSTPQQQATTSPKTVDEADPYARKRELVDELAKHADWYRDDSRFYGRLFLMLTVAVLIGSVVTSLLVAIDFANNGKAAKALVVGLPLLTGLFTTLLGQFHVQDLWKLREIGRIDALALRERVRAVPTATSYAEMRTAILPFEQEKYELERRQALAFFEYLATQKEVKKSEDGEPKK